jgi:hypothetical protein
MIPKEATNKLVFTKFETFALQKIPLGNTKTKTIDYKKYL